MVYNFITEAGLFGIDFLSFSSDIRLETGNVVVVNIRSKKYLAICVNESKEGSDTINGAKIKPVEAILPVILPKTSLDFIFKSYNFSWNKLSAIVAAVLQPIQITENKLKLLTNQIENIVDLSKRNTQFEIFNEHDIIFRIMYLIRSELENWLSNTKLSQVLIIFPDISFVEQYKTKIENELKLLIKKLNIDSLNIEILNYLKSNTVLKNQKTVLSLLEPKNKSFQLIFGTRSSVFLPFKNLNHIILIDEANNNYIQEQNRLYFDARDFSYLLSQVWNSKLSWISLLSSTRSFAFKKKDIPESQSETKTSIKPFHVLLHEKDNKTDHNKLFSNQTEEIIEDLDAKKVLFVHPRRGTFRITQCQKCKHIWHCPDCSSPLVAYKNNSRSLDLLCHHCQSNFEYPLNCPECKSSEISSYLSGIDDLTEYLQRTYPNVLTSKIQTEKFNFEKEFETLQDKNIKNYYLTTRLFDPRLPYSNFDTIVFIQAQNLSAGADYLSTEEVIYNLYSLFIRLLPVQKPVKIVFDTTFVNHEILTKIKKITENKIDFISLSYNYNQFLIEELKLRQKFNLPPFTNLLLLTANHKDIEKLKTQTKEVFNYIQSLKENMPELQVSPPYPSRISKRKGLYSYNVLVRYPKQFKQIKELDRYLKPIINQMRLQARLNPRHIF